MAWTNPDGHTTHAQCMHIKQTEVVTTMFRSPQVGSTKTAQEHVSLGASSGQTGTIITRLKL